MQHLNLLYYLGVLWVPQEEFYDGLGPGSHGDVEGGVTLVVGGGELGPSLQQHLHRLQSIQIQSLQDCSKIEIHLK